MQREDFEGFAALLDDVAALLQPGQALGGTAKAMYFRSLGAYTLAEVRQALDAHVRDPQRGRFFPKPADVIAQLHGSAADDGRPGSDEAWAGALAAADEAATVVWTEEMAQAWFVALPVFELGDKVGARMAFREAYDRLTDEARKARRPLRWQASIGHDPRQRTEAIRAAVDAGRLPKAELLQIEAPSQGIPLLELVRPVGGDTPEAKRGRAAFLELRNRLAEAPEEYRPGSDALQKERTRQLKADAAALYRIAADEQS